MTDYSEAAASSDDLETTVDGAEPAEVTDDGEDTDDVALLKKQLRDTKAAFTKKSQENAQLRGKVEVFEKLPSRAEQDQQVKDWMEDINLDDVRADAGTLVDVVKKLRGEFVDVLKARDSYWENKIKTLDPDIVSMRDRISELRSDPELANLPDDVLAVVAKKLPRSENNAEKRNVTTSNGRRAANSGGTDVRQSSLYKAIYGEAK